MQYLGDYRIDDYITFGAQLHRFSSGAVYAPTGNATYIFYENNSTTGAPTGGNLAQLNSKTGLYTARVQLTAAAGFEAGKEYLIHVEATVDSVAAAALLMFRVISNPKVDVDTIKTNPVANGGTVTFPTNKTLAAVDNITAASGVTLAASQPGVTIPTVTALTNAPVDSAGITTLLGRIVGTLATGTHNPQTGDAFTRIGAAGASLTALGDTRLANLDATVSSRHAAGAAVAKSPATIAAGDIATDAVSAAALKADAVTKIQTGISTLTAQQVWEYASRSLSSFGTLVADVVMAVWGATARTLTAFGFSVSVSSNSDKTGYSLATAPPAASAIAAAVRDVDNQTPAANSLGAAVNLASAPTANQVAAAVRDVDNSSPASGSLGAKVNQAAAAAVGAGVGAITWVYTLTNSLTGLPIADADIWVTTDAGGTNIIASGKTNQNGVVTFYLDVGTVYVWRQKSGWDFANPDTEVVV